MPYAAFVAPGMLAASAMNGALLDSTFGIFFKLRYDKVYEGVLATPMRTIDIARGELAWSLLRSAVYSAGFLAVMAAMGLVSSWWAVLAWPATWLIGFAFAGAGHGGHHVHEVLAGLRVRPARDRADVPVLRDVLPGDRLRRRRCAGWSR